MGALSAMGSFHPSIFLIGTGYPNVKVLSYAKFELGLAEKAKWHVF